MGTANAGSTRPSSAQGSTPTIWLHAIKVAERGRARWRSRTGPGETAIGSGGRHPGRRDELRDMCTDLAQFSMIRESGRRVSLAQRRVCWSGASHLHASAPRSASRAEAAAHSPRSLPRGVGDCLSPGTRTRARESHDESTCVAFKSRTRPRPHPRHPRARARARSSGWDRGACAGRGRGRRASRAVERVASRDDQ